MCPFREGAINAIKWCDALCNFMARFCVTLFCSDALHVLTSFCIFFQLFPFFITSVFFVPYFQNVEQVHCARAYADCVQVWNMQISGRCPTLVAADSWASCHTQQRTIYACHKKNLSRLAPILIKRSKRSLVKRKTLTTLILWEAFCKRLQANH